jgi:hypothetical protein
LQMQLLLLLVFAVAVTAAVILVFSVAFVVSNLYTQWLLL